MKNSSVLSRALCSTLLGGLLLALGAPPSLAMQEGQPEGFQPLGAETERGPALRPVPPSGAASALAVGATGPEALGALEDRVEVSWRTSTPIASTSRYTVWRDGTLMAVAASTQLIYEDRSTVPNTTYSYCVGVRLADGTDLPRTCDDGGRVIARPTAFDASKGRFEEHVLLTWTDHSQIEAGYNIYRDAGNALVLDGVDDYVETPGATLIQGSFTYEFWARRSSTGRPSFVVNIESPPMGDPVRQNLEIGFTADDRFSVGFGTNLLNTPTSQTSLGWHHWAVVYDAPGRRRFVYRDGELVSNDVVPTAFSAEGALEFGRRRKGGNAATRGHFHGELDEIRQWGRALTQEEIRRVRGGLLRANESGLVSYWPMDVASGLTAPDVSGTRTGTLRNMTAASWTTSGIPARYARLGANLTSYTDRTAVPGFLSYTYRVAAFEDVNADGAYTEGVDYESEQRSDTGWRGRLSPPGDVRASDGQFLDRVRVTWTDRSRAEEGFHVYRAGTRIGTVPANTTRFDDMTAALMQTSAYCVTSFGAGAESTQACDDGRRGGLEAPAEVVASNDEFDDRVRIVWADPSRTGDGFELFRDDVLLVRLGADARQHNDLSAAQGRNYGYCIRAYSEADPLASSYSEKTCAASPGRRANILKPGDLVASRNDFEDRVELKWKNRSTTAMLFLVHRGSTLIEVLDFNRTAATDRRIASDTGESVSYCVRAATVVNQNQQAAMATVAQVLYDLQTRDAANISSGLTPSTAEAKMEAVYEALGLDLAPGAAGAAARAAGYVESEPICAPGSRSIRPPTAVVASDDEFESHVRIEWADNSQVEAGYRLYRALGTAAPVPIATLSANRTTFSDFRGAPGQPFTYSVLAFDEFGESTSANNAGRRTLEPPTQFTATDGTSETAVRLSWKDNSGAELGYRVYRRVVGDPAVVLPFALIDSTGKNEPAYTDIVPPALRATEFEYEVAAFDGFGESLRAQARGKTFIQAPANVNASTAYNDRVVVVWVDRSAIEEDYFLTRRAVGTRTITEVILPKNATSYIDTSPVSGTEYEYCLRARITSNGGVIRSEPTCDIGQRSSAGIAGGGDGPGPRDGPVRITGGSLTSDRTGSLRFGFSVALSADSLALIGVPGADPRGRASLYSTVGLSPSSTPAVPFLPGSGGVFFGHAVAVSGDYAVVGDPALDNDEVGSFAVWRRAAGMWTEVTTKTQGPNSGFSVAIADSFVVVGDNQAGTSPTRHGRAAVCNVAADPQCNAPVQLDGLITKKANAQFGHAVGITRVRAAGSDSLYAIVGAPGAQEAYVFECDLATTCAAQANWTLARTIGSPFRASQNQPRAFGTAVAIDSTLAVVGDPLSEGLAVWERGDVGGWSEQQIKRGRVAEYGFSLAARGTSVIVGAPGERVGDRNGAGAAYVYVWRGGALQDETKYDARVAATPVALARFGASVDVSAQGYLVGAPGENTSGAAYTIPRGFVQTDGPIVPIEVTLVTPTGVSASDGTAPDRIQVRWTDKATNEAGHVVFRSVVGGAFERLAEVSANVEFYDDFAAAPGEAYTYCVAAFSLAPYTESGRGCDIGWRPPNGTIAGRVFSAGGAGTDDALVCLSPSVNRGLLLDGAGGHVTAPLAASTVDKPALAFENSFTVEAWVRPQAVDGTRTIVSRDSSFALHINEGRLRFTVFETGGNLGPNLVSFNADTTLTAGAWYHVAVVRDGNNNVQFFLDGKPRPLITSERLVEPKREATKLWIGQSGNGTGFFNGEIDEVRIWSTARVASEIRASRMSVLTGREESLAGYWPLDEGARRVVPDVTRAANHGSLVAGVYSTDRGADLDVCGRTASDGNFSISRIRYGETTAFDVIPTREARAFSPGFKKITLSIDSPVQNEVFFNDVTAFTVAGVVKYEDVLDNGVALSCSVPDVAIHVAKGRLASNDNLKTSTAADGSYSVAVDPSRSASDPWFIIPRGPTTANRAHTFSPASRELEVRGDMFGIDFRDGQRHVLAGNFSGGDPLTCGRNIGKAKIRISTQDGCYDRTIEVDSNVRNGAFSVELPPLEYLVEVVPIPPGPDTPANERTADIADFFARLGAVEVDLREGSVERNFVYRAPLTLVVQGLSPSTTCAAGLRQLDKNGTPLRALPAVAVLDEYEFAALEISVRENYGNGQTCVVNDGTVTIFDAIADRADADSTRSLSGGVVKYSTFGASPNIFSGARIEGVDRSFQKPITFVAQVEGRPALMETRWAIVNGFRERAATFVSATTQEFPLMILHDPPGSNSSAFVEKGSTFCSRISNTKMFGGGAGLFADLNLGFKSSVGFSFGAHFDVSAGGGIHFSGRTVAGREVTSLSGSNREICMTTTENWATSSDPGWVGEDLHMGVALNLIFALADVVKAKDDVSCSVTLSEELATDLDAANPFGTTYVYGTSHIEHSLIPQLENLVRLAGDATLSGDVNGAAQEVRLRDSVINWNKHLALGDRMKAEGLGMKNHSFSGGAEVSVSTATEETTVTRSESTRIYFESENNIGAVFNIGFDTKFGVAFDIRGEWISEEEDTKTTSSVVGYTLSDGDGGDYFSVDIGKDPRHGTYVFKTKAGRSSNPCEGDTQCRDNPLIQVSPAVQRGVNPSQAANFQLTLINASESNERRRYVIMAPPETNPNNLAINVGGGMLTAPREYVLAPGKALTINMDVYASPSANTYERVGVMMYPPDEFPIWGGDPRFPFERSDTTFFSVYFDPNARNVQTAQMTEGWNWFSINREGGEVSALLGGVPAKHGDVLKSQSAESRFDSTAGWVGNLRRLDPGRGYRIRLKNPAILRVEGEPLANSAPMKLAPGWTWIGYMPTQRMPIDDAMASLKERAVEGDAIVGRRAFAQYVKDVGWVGTLRQMVPGEGYLIHMEGGGDLRYPSAPTGRPPADPYVHETTTNGPEWLLDAGDFDASMTVVAEIQNHGVPMRKTTMKVAAFYEDEIRGVGEVHYVEALDKYLTYIMLYGDVDEQKPLVVHVYDGENDKLYEAVATISYAAQSRLGQPASPVVLEMRNAGQAPSLADLPADIALHPNFPNPFTTHTVIGYDLPEETNVKIVVYDILGRRVATLVDAQQLAGRHRAVFDASGVAGGVYFYRMELEDAVFSGRMVVVK